MTATATYRAGGGGGGANKERHSRMYISVVKSFNYAFRWEPPKLVSGSLQSEGLLINDKADVWCGFGRCVLDRQRRFK